MESDGVGGSMLGGAPAWQGLSLCAILGWTVASSAWGLTRRARSLLQPWVSRRVAADTPFVLAIQSVHHVYLDALFSVLSCFVSVPFYTAFLPLLFWSGHSKLGRQMTLLMAFCDYVGNSIKDVVSAPRPSCPPVRRVTATREDKENAMEFGLPSSHALNTVCLSGFLLHYMLTNSLQNDITIMPLGFSLAFFLIFLIGLGRIYLGMHSLVDVLVGMAIGLVILAFWLAVYKYVDNFIVSGQNVTSFWAGLSFLLCFAYPTPELPTPSFEYHTAFNGVAFGIVIGIQQTYHQFHHENVPRIFSSEISFVIFVGRTLVGLPIILIVKFCSKALAKWFLPVLCNALGIPVRSLSYVPSLKGPESCKKQAENRLLGYLQKLLVFLPQESLDVDTGIRFLQYAGLAWSVVDLVPSVFCRLRL